MGHLVFIILMPSMRHIEGYPAAHGRHIFHTPADNRRPDGGPIPLSEHTHLLKVFLVSSRYCARHMAIQTVWITAHLDCGVRRTIQSRQGVPHALQCDHNKAAKTVKPVATAMQKSASDINKYIGVKYIFC